MCKLGCSAIYWLEIDKLYNNTRKKKKRIVVHTRFVYFPFSIGAHSIPPFKCFVSLFYIHYSSSIVGFLFVLLLNSCQFHLHYYYYHHQCVQHTKKKFTYTQRESLCHTEQFLQNSNSSVDGRLPSKKHIFDTK